MNIKELAERREKAALYVQRLGMENTYGKTLDEQIASSARYQLAQDAWLQAERDYRAAISGMSAEELMALSRSRDEDSSPNND